VTLLFDGVDVLAALTHIRSVGVTTAIVDISNGLVETISLHFADASQASMTYWDYGAQLAVDPVPKTG
jgi:hypothetical protein